MASPRLWPVSSRDLQWGARDLASSVRSPRDQQMGVTDLATSGINLASPQASEGRLESLPPSPRDRPVRQLASPSLRLAHCQASPRLRQDSSQASPILRQGSGQASPRLWAGTVQASPRLSQGVVQFQASPRASRGPVQIQASPRLRPMSLDLSSGDLWPEQASPRGRPVSMAGSVVHLASQKVRPVHLTSPNVVRQHHLASGQGMPVARAVVSQGEGGRGGNGVMEQGRGVINERQGVRERERGMNSESEGGSERSSERKVGSDMRSEREGGPVLQPGGSSCLPICPAWTRCLFHSPTKPIVVEMHTLPDLLLSYSSYVKYS